MVLVELGDQAIGRGGAESFAFTCSVALRQTAFKLDETRRSLLVSLLSGIRSGRNLSSWVVVAVKCTLCMCGFGLQSWILTVDTLTIAAMSPICKTIADHLNQ
jgi:hypothetical protein